MIQSKFMQNYSLLLFTLRIFLHKNYYFNTPFHVYKLYNLFFTCIEIFYILPLIHYYIIWYLSYYVPYKFGFSLCSLILGYLLFKLFNKFKIHFMLIFIFTIEIIILILESIYLIQVPYVYIGTFIPKRDRFGHVFVPREYIKGKLYSFRTLYKDYPDHVFQNVNSQYPGPSTASKKLAYYMKCHYDAIRESIEFSRMANLGNLGPMLDRQGKGALYDVVTEFKRECKQASEREYSAAKFYYDLTISEEQRLGIVVHRFPEGYIF